VIHDGRVTKTPNFKDCRWRLEADITADELKVGILKVGYLDAWPIEKSPFSNGEKKLIQAVAGHISMAVQTHRLKDTLRESEKRYQALLENASPEIAERKRADDTITQKKRPEFEDIFFRDEIIFKEGLDGIIGDSDPLKYVIYRVRQVAPTKTTVLLTGETGTGKGLFARFLHKQSDRRNKPLVIVNCASLPANLIESELFGREKGAFTGSTSRQIGRFELANDGTIFLDEIGELPIELQAKLLKVTEEGEFERLGSPHTAKVDVRIIASTNRNLKEEMEKGLFRKDLYYRLSVFPIIIPPLRERKEDIPDLVFFFAQKFSKAYRKGIERISVKFMNAFENYAWPGNVRELINIVEGAVIGCDGCELTLPDQIFAEPVNSLKQNDDVQKPQGLVEVEKELILKTLWETGWRIEGERGAAQCLDMNPSTLRTRIKKLGIRRPGSLQ
jgi:transcriptional regulator with GAF, ATPase, and Fis domain